MTDTAFGFMIVTANAGAVLFMMVVVVTAAA
jgi:hypothetical protein